MKKMNKFIIAGMILILGISLSAGPTIIRDDRIQDLALTPTLGRGYTMVTNTFQSKCMENVQITDPSYDFTYKFESIESTKSSSSSKSGSLGVNASYGPVELKLKAGYGSSKEDMMNNHHVLVEINMDTYYASVDESRTKLSGSAAALLTKNDVPGFFSSCGTYYVRSLGRHAKFVSVFTYSDKSSKKDSKFEAELEIMIKSAGAGGGVNSSVASSVAAASSEKRLMITTSAFGLGKNEGATLISYDIDSFKAAIKDAFISMQNPMTGKVTTMEIVPWVENTEFQSLIPLETTVPKEGGAPIPLFKKKYNLILNGEYAAEIERADRNFMNIYYKAKICKQTIEANWVKVQESMGGAGAGGMQAAAKHHPLKEEFKDAVLINNKHQNERYKLSDLYDKELKDVDKYLDQEYEFMYKASAEKCLEEMMKDNNMMEKTWRQMPTCVKIRGMLSGVLSQNIDDYCMPKLDPNPPSEEK